MWILISVYVVFVVVRPHEWVDALAGVPILFATAALAFVAWLFRGDKALNTPQHLAVPAFVLAAIFSRVAMGWISGALMGAEELLPFVAIFLATSVVAETPQDFIRFLKVLVVCALVLAFHGIDQITHGGVGWTGQTVEESTGFPRIQYIGIFADPNDLAMLFVGATPLAIYFMRNAGALLRLVWGGAAALLMYGLYLTNSRGGLLALIGVALLWGTTRVGKIATGVLAAVALPALVAATRLTGGIDTEEESAGGRIDAWYEGLQMFQEHPLFGVGHGQFLDYNQLTAHNSWVLVLAETGFPGYTAWFAATTISLLMLWKMSTVGAPTGGNVAAAAVENDQKLAGALFYSSLGMAIAAFFLSRSYNLLFFLIWAWSAGHTVGFVRRNPWFVPINLWANKGRWLLLSAGSIAALFVIVRVLLLV